MTQDEIIKLVTQAGIYHELGPFVKLVAAAEREACAEVVDKRLKTWASLAGKDKAYRWLEKLSAAIRARGQS